MIWASKLQTSTATSTSEAAFTALAYLIKVLRWLHTVLSEVDVIDSGPIEINQNNLGSISWTSATNGLRNIKHVGKKHHSVCDAVESKIVQVMYTPSPENQTVYYKKRDNI